MSVAEITSLEPKEETRLQLQMARIRTHGRDADDRTTRTQGRDQNASGQSHNAQREGRE